MTIDALTEVNYSSVSTTPIPELSTQTTSMNTTTISTLSNANNTSTSPTEVNSISIKPIQKQTAPTDCSQRQESRNQPKFTSNARLRKCCPFGENLDYYRENQSDSMCDNAVLQFEPIIISAMLYDNCIEDLEIKTELPIEIGNPCNK